MERRKALGIVAGGLATAFAPWVAKAETSRTPLGYLRTNWSRDPFSFGSYSYVAKVSIIGAGMSGLTAAKTLFDEGVDRRADAPGGMR